MKNRIPHLLIYSRLVLGFLILALAFLKIEGYRTAIVILLTLGLLTDIFDGIIARKLQISTTSLRRLDSTIDQIFFVSTIIATYLICETFFKEHWLSLLILGGSEILIYFLSLIKFKKEVATHTLGAKFWTLILFATLIEIIFTCESPILYWICFWLGLATRLEIMAILLILKNWTNDVPTFYHAIQLKKGKKIKRNKLFNG